VEDRWRAAWGVTAAVAAGGLSLLFVAGPALQTLLLALIAGAATFLALDIPAVGRRWRSRRRR